MSESLSERLLGQLQPLGHSSQLLQTPASGSLDTTELCVLPLTDEAWDLAKAPPTNLKEPGTQARQLTRWGHSPSHQKAALRPPEPTAGPEHTLSTRGSRTWAATHQHPDPGLGASGPCRHGGGTPGPSPTQSEQEPAPESPGPWPHSP